MIPRFSAKIFHTKKKLYFNIIIDETQEYILNYFYIMKKHIVLFVIIILAMNTLNSQNKKIPYYEIPDYPDSYKPGTVAARMIDGLGFRYYWASEGLRAEDLKFRPNDKARTTEETIDHILGLSTVIVNTSLKKTNIKNDFSKFTFNEKRNKTLQNLKTSADILRASNDLTEFQPAIIFKKEKGTTELPFWNMINGPIADALWHCGQIVSFRRSSGNPYNSNASVLTGKVRN